MDPVAIPLARGRGSAIVSAEDAAAALAFKWWRLEPKDSTTAYASAIVSGHGRSRRTMTLHQFVARRMGIAGDGEPDHENGDGLDCRRNNLRPASHSQNLANRGPQRNNTSGFKGVTRTRRGPWMAQIQVRGRNRYLGTFSSPEAAARVYDAWAIAAFGEFARLNFH